MKLKYIKSQSSVKPDLVDTTSSKTTVYIRQNIVENIKTDEMSGKETIFYEYEEAKLTKAEYQEYLKELEIIDIQKQRADIDYIALMSGIDLEV
jgi:hypothetical protein